MDQAACVEPPAVTLAPLPPVLPKLFSQRRLLGRQAGFYLPRPVELLVYILVRRQDFGKAGRLGEIGPSSEFAELDPPIKSCG